MEQIYMDSGLVPYILQYPRYFAVVARTDADIKAAIDQNLVAKIIVVGPYVYVGSINIGYYSIQRNREVGLLIYNPQLADRLRALILQWYVEAGGEVPTQITATSPAQPVATTTAQGADSAGVEIPLWHVLVWLVAIILAALFVVWMNRRRL
jgi:hypothetical protein